MKSIFVIMILFSSAMGFAQPASSKSIGQSIGQTSDIENRLNIAKNLVSQIYGRGYEPMEATADSQSEFRITIGTGDANSGAAIYLVKFLTLNEGGALENEVVADIKIVYVGGN